MDGAEPRPLPAVVGPGDLVTARRPGAPPPRRDRRSTRGARRITARRRRVGRRPGCSSAGRARAAAASRGGVARGVGARRRQGPAEGESSSAPIWTNAREQLGAGARPDVATGPAEDLDGPTVAAELGAEEELRPGEQLGDGPAAHRRRTSSPCRTYRRRSPRRRGAPLARPARPSPTTRAIRSALRDPEELARALELCDGRGARPPARVDPGGRTGGGPVKGGGDTGPASVSR